ncbi:SDR family NAD(P)-dependent oxidoreductase [Salipaludibacillus sp. CF4.18]|uniref:SDR family NAD(P)-dependent oxidoreductase n=1 Tax=Salipaludibacillus sp. CF4.18 TaxID=3373081 RepID=UPI003EE4F223
MSIFDKDALKDEHILITGATGGIGYVTAIEVVKCGGHVTITGRNEAKLQNLKQECQSINDQARVNIISANIAKEQDRINLVEKTVKHNGPITGLVNSAGIVGGDTMEQIREDDLREVMDVNYTSTVLLTQLVYREMIKKQKGSIVNISSLSGLRGTYGNTAYSASKFALIGFTQSFALEAIEHSIRVNAICPGFVDTEMGRGAIEKKAKQENRSYEKQLEIVNNRLPSKRITGPEEVANSIIFLLTDAAENIVGESMKISGGSVMR